MFGENTFRQRMQRYYSDMAVNLALSTHKDALSESQTDMRLVSEVAALAVRVALGKYDAENQTVIAQADSFHRLAEERNATRIPMHILKMVQTDG